jgi:uncharacterized membrane protein
MTNNSEIYLYLSIGIILGLIGFGTGIYLTTHNTVYTETANATITFDNTDAAINLLNSVKSYNYTYTYNVKNTTYSGITTSAFPRLVGEKITVYYEPSNPSNNTDMSQSKTTGILTIVGSILVIIICAVIMYFMYKHNQQY